MDLFIVIAALVVVIAGFVVPYLLVVRWERREQQRLAEEVQRFLDGLRDEVQGFVGPGEQVRRAAVGRVRAPVWRTALVVALVVVALSLPWAVVDVLALVAAAVVWAVGHRPRVVATTDDAIVVIATTWRWHPLRVVARVERSAWRPPVRGLGPQVLGDEVIVLRSGQAAALPDAPAR